MAVASPMTIAAAQETGGVHTPATATRARGLWVSAGLGGATPYPIALRGSINYSYRAALVTIGAEEARTLFDDGARDQELMVGLRTAGSGAFLTGSLGYARAYRVIFCDDGCGTRFDHVRSALAYAGTLHLVTQDAVGVSLTAAGVLGPDRLSHLSVTLAVEAGRFRF